MQLLTYETVSENIDMTDATQLYTSFDLQGHARVQIFTYKDVCVYAMCRHLISINVDRHVSTQICRLQDVFMRVFAH